MPAGIQALSTLSSIFEHFRPFSEKIPLFVRKIPFFTPENTFFTPLFFWKKKAKNKGGKKLFLGEKADFRPRWSIFSSIIDRFEHFRALSGNFPSIPWEHNRPFSPALCARG
jgi:hypothetical protein